MTTKIPCILSLMFLLGCDMDQDAPQKTLSAQEPLSPIVVGAEDMESIRSWVSNYNPSRPALVMVLADNEVREIDAAGFVDYYVQVPGRVCVAEARFEGVTGDERDFEVLILGRTGYSNWERGMPVEGVQSGRQVEWTFNQVLPSTGAWHFVVSNRFSSDSSKTVRVSAKVTCPGRTSGASWSN